MRGWWRSSPSQKVAFLSYWQCPLLYRSFSVSGGPIYSLILLLSVLLGFYLGSGLLCLCLVVRLAKVKNTNDSLCGRGCGVRGTLIHCWWECKLVQPLWKSVWRFLRKLGVNLPQDPAVPLLGIYPRDALSYYKSICSTLSTLLFEKCSIWSGSSPIQLD